MNTQRLSRGDTELAGKILKNGGIVAIPTETVYGLAANAFDPAAIKKIFEAKGRPQDNPLIVHIWEIGQLETLCRDIPPEAYKLASAFWPGPLTIVLKKKDCVPDEVTAGLPNVAVRFPSHPVAHEIIKAAGVPLAAPSANKSGSPSPTCAAHVLSDLDGKIDAVVDGGECGVGVESTVVSLIGERPRLLRPGGITHEQLTAILGQVDIDRAVTQKISDTEKVSAPGMKYRHYAPRCPVKAVCGDGAKSAEYIRENARQDDAVICYRGFSGVFGKLPTFPYGDEGDMKTLAHGLFAALRAADTANTKRIFIQCPSDAGIGLAVANRIKKAAGFDIIYLK